MAKKTKTKRKIPGPGKDRAAAIPAGRALVPTGKNGVALIPQRKTRMIPIHHVDPRQQLLANIGDCLDGIDIFHNTVLVAVYIRPKDAMLAGVEMEISDKTRKEDEYQGIVGLVLKKGPGAFAEDMNTRFYGCDVNVGDWVYFRASDGIRMEINGVLCRRVTDVNIEGRVSHPDMVY